MPKHRAKTSRRDQLVGGSEELVVEVVSLHANHRQFATFARQRVLKSQPDRSIWLCQRHLQSGRHLEESLK